MNKFSNANTNAAAQEYQKLNDLAKRYIEEIQAQLRPKVLKSAFWTANKIFSRLFD